MKRFSIIILAAALLFGMAQCKKQETPNADSKWVHITMKVGGSDKHVVYPNTGAVLYSNGDKIYVGNNNKYIGTLEYQDGTFSGDIYSPSTTDYLHFYFVGGLETGDLEEGTTDSFNVNISNQNGKLPVLSYGRSSQLYTDGTATYSCMLENKCGLVKFVPSVATSLPITVSGMKTTATIDFSAGSITPTDTTGSITLNSESNAVKWAVLLEQSEVANPTITISGFEAAITSVPTITNNYYNNSGVGISMTFACPEGAIAGLFSVSETTQVYFSKGNLQYVGTSWQFATNQYDILGNPQSSDRTDYFGYNSYTCPEGWRNMSQTEWAFVITNRSVSNTLSDGARFTLATIGGSYKGMILFPDNYTHPDGTGFVAGTYNAASNYTATVSLEGWALMEVAGCVFLPAAGWLNGSSINDIDYGCYNSTTHPEGYGTRYYDPMFGSGSIDMTATSFNSTGTSVRLVWEL